MDHWAGMDEMGREAEEEFEARRASFAMGVTCKRTVDELALGDLIWHSRTLLYRPLEEVRYTMDGRWELRLQGGHSAWLPDRWSPHPDHVIRLEGAGPEYLRRSNNGLGAPPKGP
jgi:hypothetical protein